MKLLTFSLACILSVISLQMNGQRERMVDSLNHSVGLHISSTSGYGLSYRYRPNRLGVQLTFTPYKNTDRTTLVSGLSFMYVVSQYRDINFFLYQGNSYRFDSRLERSTNAVGELVEERVKRHYTSHGIGFGIEYFFHERMGGVLGVGYGAYDNFEIITIAGQAGVFFYL